jgi:hypothetical protein
MTKSRRIKWAGHVACGGGGGEKRNSYRILMGKSKRRRLLGRHRHSWKGNTKINPKET